MNEKIQEELDRETKILKAQLTHDELIMALDTVCRIWKGEGPINPMIDKLYKTTPSLNNKPEAQETIYEIMLMLTGRHYVRQENFEENTSVDLSSEITNYLCQEFSTIIHLEGYYMCINEERLNPDIKALGNGVCTIEIS